MKKSFLMFVLAAFACLFAGCESGGGGVTDTCAGNPFAHFCDDCAACSAKYSIDLECDSATNLCMEKVVDNKCPVPGDASCDKCEDCSKQYNMEFVCDSETNKCKANVITPENDDCPGNPFAKICAADSDCSVCTQKYGIQLKCDTSKMLCEINE